MPRKKAPATRAKKPSAVSRTKPGDVDAYVAACAADVQPILQRFRRAIRKVVPEAQERISYSMPAYHWLGGDGIFFAAFKKHIGVFPPVRGDEALLRQLAEYLGPKGNLKFPLDRPMPWGLIQDVIKNLAQHHRARQAAKGKN